MKNNFLVLPISRACAITSKTVHHIMEDNFALRYVFKHPGVNSRTELVPLHGAPRRRLGDNNNNNNFRGALLIVLERKLRNQVFKDSSAIGSTDPLDSHGNSVGYNYVNVYLLQTQMNIREVQI